MNPLPKGRGLQLARNDKAAACGRMTSARQNPSAAACAVSPANATQCTLATSAASNAGKCGWQGATGPGATRCPWLSDPIQGA